MRRGLVFVNMQARAEMAVTPAMKDMVARHASIEPQEPHLRHISLSRTFDLPKHLTPNLIATLTYHLRSFSPFQISFKDCALFPTTDPRVAFAGLMVEQGRDTLVEITRRVDGVLKNHNLSAYFEDGVPHMSFAKVPVRSLARLQRAFDTPESPQLRVDGVECRLGSHFHRIALGNPTVTEPSPDMSYEQFVEQFFSRGDIDNIKRHRN